MMKRLIAAALALTFAITPGLASAQDAMDAATAMEKAREEGEALTDVTTVNTVNFNQNEDLENILLLDLSTGERVAIRLMPAWAPKHVERIKTLTRQGFYDGVIFHRVIDGYMAQTGDPTGTGRGGSSLPDLTQEFNASPHVRGTVSMARAQSEDSANSQFFIVFYPRLVLDRNYTNFGRVIANMPAVDAIERGEPPANPTKILQASIAADHKAPPKVEQPAAVQQDFTADLLSNSASD